ncbi:MAG: hypothetical protein QOJ19_4420 [Acidimicrobiia bacterium]|nr:hypothetical protein [Acidimicrobiia bacterium]
MSDVAAATPPPRNSQRDPAWSALIGSLVPWVAFLLATIVADFWVDFRRVSYSGLATGAPVYLPFVALPSLLPLVAARSGWPRSVVLVVMTAVGAVAGTLVMTTDDAQAGLAVLIVPYVAVPFAAVIAIFRWLVGRVTSQVRQRRIDLQEP